MTDPVAVLIRAWIAWDNAARAMPRYPTAGTLRVEASALAQAIAALGVDGNRLHGLVAAHRRRHIAGHPEGPAIPDAVVSALNELGVDVDPQLKEAS